MSEYEKRRAAIEETIQDDKSKIELAQVSIQTAQAILAGDPELTDALARQQVALLRDLMVRKGKENDPISMMGIRVLEDGVKFLREDAMFFFNAHKQQQVTP